MRSEIDRYLDLPRSRNGPVTPLSVVDVQALVTAAQRARFMPKTHAGDGGQRTHYLVGLAREYGVSVRTIHRYLATPIEPVRVGGYVALFRTGGGGPPRRMTEWEPERQP